MIGIILTHTASLTGTFYPVARRFDSVKVVTGWGLGKPWTLADRARILAMTPTTVVRTVNGDPSYRGGAFRWPEPEAIRDEIAPWISLQPHVSIEIGNEPNVAEDWSEETAWAYRYWLEQTLGMLRRTAPHARLIAPGPSFVHAGAVRYLEICADIMRGYDAVAAHIYGHQSFSEPGVQDAIWQYDRLFDRTIPRVITELGIREGSNAARLLHYRLFAQRLAPPWGGAYVYHYCEDGRVDPWYHVG